MLDLCLVALPCKCCELCIPIWTTVGVCGHAAPMFLLDLFRNSSHDGQSLNMLCCYTPYVRYLMVIGLHDTVKVEEPQAGALMAVASDVNSKARLTV